MRRNSCSPCRVEDMRYPVNARYEFLTQKEVGETPN